VRVRRATAADADAMTHVHSVSSDTAYAHVAGRSPGRYERRLQAWRDVLAANHSAFVAETDDGTTVGVLSVSERELHVIYVHPDWWGSGAGQLLIEKAHEVLATTCDEAILTVLAANPRARRFYERNAWVPAEFEIEPHFGGVPTEVVRYRKLFR
jgi:GNAT superfamily N-acetyltransferase